MILWVGITYRMDSHHLPMHRERSVGIIAISYRLKRQKRTRLLQIILQRLTFALLSLRLRGKIPRLEGTTVEAGTIGIETLTNNFTATDNNSTMSIVKRRHLSLSKAEGQIGVVAWRHVVG